MGGLLMSIPKIGRGVYTEKHLKLDGFSTYIGAKFKNLSHPIPNSRVAGADRTIATISVWPGNLGLWIN